MKYFKYSEEIKKQICDLYLQGNSYRKISIILKIPKHNIPHILNKAKILRRTLSESRRIYDLNESAFDNLSDPNVLYWLGMLLSDGHVSSRNYFSLGLKYEDDYHVKAFAKFLGTNRPVGKYLDHGKFPQSRLWIQSKRLCERLKLLGVVENKSLIATPSPLVENSFDFWRGMIDGDGCISINTKRNKLELSLAGSKNVCLSFQRFVKNQFQIDLSIYPHRNIFIVKCSSHYKSLEILEKIYNGNVALKRKENRFLRFKQLNIKIK